MAWRFVLQPNGKLARFSDIVDNFTDVDLTDEEAMGIARQEVGIGREEARAKIQAARADITRDGKKGRWNESLATIRAVHGEAVFREIAQRYGGFTD